MIDLRINKTYNYLSPIIDTFDPVFLENFSKIQRIGYTIHDTLFDGSTLYPYSIFVVYKKRRRDYIYNLHLKAVLESSYCIFNYNPTSEPFSDVGCFILKIPEEFHETYSQFLQGNYSKMYSQEQIDLLFDDKDPVRQVLLKKEIARQNFINQLTKDFELKISLSNFYPDEYDYPLVAEEEILNFVDGDAIYLSEELTNKLMNKGEIYELYNK